MTEAELFGQVAPKIIEQPTDYSGLQAQAQANALPDEPVNSTQALVQGTSLSRSEALHFLAQPPEDISQLEFQIKKDEVVAPEELLPRGQVQMDSTSEEIKNQDKEAENNNSGYLIKILALFFVAIAVAALLKPHYVDDKAESPAADSQPQPVLITPTPVAESEPPVNANAQVTAPNAVNAGQLPVASDQSKTNSSFTFSPTGNPVQATTEIPASATVK